MKSSMKGKLILFTILLILFLGFIYAKYFVLDQQNNFGELKVISSPETSLFFDNVAVGKTPFDGKYKVGEYLLKLIPVGSATETASWQGRVSVYKNALTYVNRELGSSDVTSAGEIFTAIKMDHPPQSPGTGEVYVDTDPTGAIIYLDNDEKGVGPLILDNVIKGTHELSVFLPGFFRRTQKINVAEDYRVNASFKLAIDQSQKQATPSSSLKQATGSANLQTKTKIKIKDTPTGFLRVREGPSIDASEEAQVKPGATFDLLDQSDGWYKISYEANKEGWVAVQYCEKVE